MDTSDLRKDKVIDPQDVKNLWTDTLNQAAKKSISAAQFFPNSTENRGRNVSSSSMVRSNQKSVQSNFILKFCSTIHLPRENH